MPTIKKPNEHFDAVLWTGNGPSSQNITSLNFQPDLVWVKNRSSTRKHNIYDSVRGTTKRLVPNDTVAEDTPGGVTAFNSNGFTVDSEGDVNASTLTFVGWTWKAGGASTVNTSGSISSNVSVNATAGFSVVTYTNSAGRNAHTVGHGLGVAPKMFIIKTRSATADWPVYHASLGATKAVYLNSTLAEQTSAAFFNNTNPSSSVITLGSGLSDAGVTIVAYCWAEVEGYSKFGSFTGNNSLDGPFIYTGFKPAFIMIKRTDVSSDWFMLDDQRPTFNVIGGGNGGMMAANQTYAESTLSSYAIADFLSNGVKIRSDMNYGYLNASGGTYIYMAFAEAPFKYSSAR